VCRHEQKGPSERHENPEEGALQLRISSGRRPFSELRERDRFKLDPFIHCKQSSDPDSLNCRYSNCASIAKASDSFDVHARFSTTVIERVRE
jgi:hypothetical protein